MLKELLEMAKDVILELVDFIGFVLWGDKDDR